jgi:GAF domain-containing protein
MPNNKNQEKATQANIQKQADIISLWREQLVNFILRGSAAIGLFTWGIYVVIYIQSQDWRNLAIVTVVYAALIAITLLKVPYAVRAYGMVIVTFSLYVNSLVLSGIRGDANVYLITAVTITMMLLGLRAGITVLGLSILAVVGIGWGVINHQILLRDLFDQLNPSVWISHSIVTYMLAIIVAIGLILLQREFFAAQQRERAALDEVSNERSHLVERVAERTRDLQLAAEIGRTSAEKVTNRDEMLMTAAKMIYARFPGYYVQIYLTDPKSRSIILHAGVGEDGEQLLQRGHHLLIDSGSLNGRAVLEKKPVIVADTTQSANFMPNPLLPNIHSEMVMPLIVGEQVIGTLDIQSEQISGVNETHLPAFEALAGQLAIAIQNATLFSEVQQARSEVEEQVHRLAQEGWRDFLNAIERGQKIGYVFDQTDTVPINTADLLTTPAGALRVPVSVSGTQIGQIQLTPETERAWTNSETALAQSAAAQLAQHVDNLRLVALSKRYQVEAEQAVRHLTHEGWTDYKEQVGEIELGFVYDQNEVKPLAPSPEDKLEPDLVYEINAHGETIAEFGIAGTAPLSDEDVELVAIVGERLSAQLENLRLTQQTEQALAETEDLYQGSEKIVNAATISAVLAALIESTTLSQLERASLNIFDHPWDPQNPPEGMTMVSSWIRDNKEAIVPLGTYYRFSEFPVAKFLALNEMMVFSDISADPRFDERSRQYFLETLKVKSVIGLPLVVDGHSIGGIVAQSSQALKISEAETRKINSLLSQVTTVIQSKRLFEQVREQAKREQALRQITSAVRGSTDPATIMRTAVRELGNVLGRKTLIRMARAETTVDHESSSPGDASIGTMGGEA